jgi:uncharacterized protein
MTEILLVTKGHPFEREPFFEVFDFLRATSGINHTHVEQPAAQQLFHPDRLGPYDVVVCYDMPGIAFTRSADPAVSPVRFDDPPADYVAGFEACLDAGVPFLFLHHTIAGWPTWERYAEIVGGRFHYQPGSLRGVEYPDSGYLLNVDHTVEVIEPTHPVCAGLPPSFMITDELYLSPVFEDDVTPLLRTTFDTADDRRFFSADLAIRGRRNANSGWSHPAGSNLVAWEKRSGNSPVVYLQFGDSPVTYADENFRRILANAITYLAGAQPSIS